MLPIPGDVRAFKSASGAHVHGTYRGRAQQVEVAFQLYVGEVMGANHLMHESEMSGKKFEPLLSTEEAAAHLRLHPKTLQRMARQGHVPSIRIGKYWHFRLSALDAWVRALENRCSQPFCVK